VLPLVKVDHVALAMPVGGEDRARTFYVETLGLQEVPKPPELRGRGGLWLHSVTDPFGNRLELIAN
jgi:catechol 2,3-dioxygenase-like lactoylglutathione lyase family enzyme